MNRESLATSSPREPPISLGTEISRARISLGWSLDQLSQKTRLNKQVLMELERDSYDNLPAVPYIKAFLVTLSKHLNLDAGSVIARFHQATGLTLEPASGSIDPSSALFRRKPNHVTPVVIIALLLLILVLAFSLLKDDILEKYSAANSGLQTSENTPRSSAFPEKKPLSPADSSKLGESVEAFPIPMENKVKSIVDVGETVPEIVERIPVKPAPAPVSPNPADRAGLLVFESLLDTVWIKIKRKSRPDASKLLLRGKTWKVAYSDTIRIQYGVLGGVRLYAEGKILTPGMRRFVLYKGKLID